MAKLGFTFSPAHFWAVNDLHQGKHMRQVVIDRLEKRVAEEKAGPQELTLLDSLRNAKRGRQPYGAKHRWIEIGRDNEEMREAGLSHAERMKALALKYHLSDEAKLKTAIAQYEAGMEEARRILNEE